MRRPRRQVRTEPRFRPPSTASRPRIAQIQASKTPTVAAYGESLLSGSSDADKFRNTALMDKAVQDVRCSADMGDLSFRAVGTPAGPVSRSRGASPGLVVASSFSASSLKRSPMGLFEFPGGGGRSPSLPRRRIAWQKLSLEFKVISERGPRSGAWRNWKTAGHRGTRSSKWPSSSTSTRNGSIAGSPKVESRYPKTPDTDAMCSHARKPRSIA